MPRPHLAELAHDAYWRYHGGTHPVWAALPLLERLAWGMAARAAVQEAHRLPCAMGIQVPSKRMKGATMRCLVCVLVLLGLVGVLQAQPMGSPIDPQGATEPLFLALGMRGTVQAPEAVPILNPERLLIWADGHWGGKPPDTCQIEAQAGVLVVGWDTLGVMVEYEPLVTDTPPVAGSCPRGTIFERTQAQLRDMQPVFGPAEAAAQRQRERVKRLVR